ncbi:response regulator with CheY-like receiver, AAA-type ATPase, and DNA-binding domains [Acidovorax sp. CF316]|uniref:sigma-54-dependent transcriptional regulator n=1 Tax=Acidovorax sp. CF316 TaxID=1144317 RepID=UPI00026BC68C|nr:sigma-54 dependent transcriptional regulator [Acidovorax sp. CF316]EJE54046.1 response regulator with CheY-like receiver, AAA-type ATPase, and DNA-binding domains [Acidovorax sp. CF316]
MHTPPDAADRGRILLVDDEPAFQRLGANFLRGLGHEVLVAGDGEQALAAFATQPAPDLVLLDLAMPPSMDPEAGLALVPRFARVPVIVWSGHGDHELALRAAELGAWDFLTKPIDPDMLRFVIGRALRKAKLDAELRALRAVQAGDDMGLIGQAQATVQLRAMVRRVGPTRVSVLVLGPTGSGKELVARALHACSPQSASGFVAIHCGALSAELLESELFGHLKGSFTGAYRDQPGLVEVAHGGTLFLDEVGEMPPPMQVKLLRFLQEGTFVPVGGRSQKKAEVRVVAATHRDLEAMVRDGSFREDLYYRLKGVVLRTPALSERPADVPLLATRFLHRVAPRAGLSGDALAWLAAREWPGNVRELKALIEAAGALLLQDQPEVDAPLLRLAAGEADEGHHGAAESADPLEGLGPLDAALAELERRLVRDAMQSAGGNQSEAARRLGISRVGLIKKLARLGLR